MIDLKYEKTHDKLDIRGIDRLKCEVCLNIVINRTVHIRLIKLSATVDNFSFILSRHKCLHPP